MANHVQQRSQTDKKRLSALVTQLLKQSNHPLLRGAEFFQVTDLITEVRIPNGVREGGFRFYNVRVSESI